MKKTTKNSKTKPVQLNLLNPKCAGIDVGATELFVCIAKNSSEHEVRSFSTFTIDIRQMVKWLKESGVESVAMESTGVYWIAPYEILEEAGFEVLLVNARFFKSVPGRKTDVQDCQWIQQLHSYGLLRGSFRPTGDIIELRSYVRQRSRLFESASMQIQLMQKAFIQMNIQLHHVISDIAGETGMNIIHAILKGIRDPKALANLSVAGCRKKKSLIEKALEGNYRKEHVFALEQAHEAFEFFNKQILKCEKSIEDLLPALQGEEPLLDRKKCVKKTPSKRSPYYFDGPTELAKVTKADLTTIPGIDANTAMKIVSEIGTDMSRWDNAKAFASWLGLCPGNKISGGKILNSKTKPTDNRASQALRMASFTLYRSKTAIGAFLRRLRARLGAPKAITAVAHKLARIIYRMLSDGTNYRDVGENYYEQQYQARVIANLRKRAEDFGFVLTPVNPTAN